MADEAPVVVSPDAGVTSPPPAAGSVPAGSGTIPSAPATGAAAGGAPQTPEQVKAAADAEALRVSTLTPEQKAAEAKAATDKAAAAAPPDFTGLKMPEGYKTDTSDPVFGEALKLFGDNKIAPDVAQKLLDFTVTRDKAIAQAINDHNAQNWKKQAGDWKTVTEKEFSPEDLGGAKTAAAQVFDKDTLTYLEGLDFTNHPGFVRGMVKIFKAIKDDTWVSGNAPNGSAARTAQQMFPNSKMNP